MKETIKAGIGGHAFTLDIDAFEALDSYLNNLKSHFQNKDDGAEIITDIESRMSELLQMKVKTPNIIITLQDALHIIEIMGNPSDFEDEAGNNETENTAPTNKKKEPLQIDKKLFRDMEHSVLGGVCSGLGAYFRIDPVIIRIAYVLGIILTNQFSDRLSALIFISYFILWAVMPKAKTMLQKLAMSGQDPSIADIEKFGSLKTKEMRGSSFGRVLKKILKIFISLILYIVGISILLGVFLALFFPSITDLPTIKEFMEVTGFYSDKLAVSITLAWLIPAFMILYFAIKLMIKFTTKDLAVLGIAFIVWLAACGYTATKSVKFAKDFKSKETVSEKIVLKTKSDTLLFELGKYYKEAESVVDIKELYYIEGETKSWFIIPRIEIRKSNKYTDFEIEIKKTAFAGNNRKAKEKAENARLILEERDSRIRIEPHLYNKNKKWDREYFKIIIYCPENKTVKVEDLLEFRTTTNYVADESKKQGEESLSSEESINPNDSVKII